jgi:hypothetical protein
LATIAFLETELSIPSERVGNTGLIPGLTSEIRTERDITETMLNKEVTQTALCIEGTVPTVSKPVCKLRMLWKFVKEVTILYYRCKKGSDW